MHHQRLVEYLTAVVLSNTMCADLCSVNNGGCPSDAICKVQQSLVFSYLF